ncbi:MAG: hypothetical protein K8E24_012095 [Methanobacterium paludis]|nr:hypothetical protein [Methanobacterium paludis]
MTYANEEAVTNLTTKVKPNADTTNYDATMELALNFADSEINDAFIISNIPFPTVPETIDDRDPLNTLINAANLIAACFIFDHAYSGNTTLSALSTEWKKKATTKIDNYIQIILEGYDEETETKDEPVKLPPVGSLVQHRGYW